MECLTDPLALAASRLASTNTGTTGTYTRTTGMTGITTQTIGIVIGAAGKATVTWMAGTATLPKGTMITTTTGTTEGVHQGALDRRPSQ
jgi:hypothetical protein